MGLWTPQAPAIIRPPELWTPGMGDPFSDEAYNKWAMPNPVRRRRGGSAGGGGSGGGAPTVTYIGGAQATPFVLTFDMGDFVIPADGLVVVLASAVGGSTRALTSLTVGGTSGTVVSGVADDLATGIGTCEKSAGTHNITVVWTASSARCEIFVYLIEGLVSATATDSDNDGTTGTSASLSTVTIDPNGVALFICATGADEAHAWSGGPTEDDEVSYEVDRHSCAQMSSVGGETPTATCSWTSTSSQSISGASWA